MKHYTLGLAAILVALAGGANAEDAVKNAVVKKSDRDFFVFSDPIQLADVYGLLKESSHGTFGQFPANFETPVHVHSHSYRAVVISGEMTNPFEGEGNPPVMEAGSYWSVAANAVHSTACVSDTPCEFFMFSDFPFDFTPVE